MTQNTHDRRGFLKALLIGVAAFASLPLLAPPASAEELDDFDFDANAQAGNKNNKRRRTRRARRRKATRRAKRRAK
jgi:hypothetical protein